MKPHHSPLPLAFAACLAGSPALADSLRLATDPFDEEVLSAARISGSLVTGVQRGRPGGDGIALSAHVPAALAGATLCARVTSIDGLYQSANVYDVPADWAGGVAGLPYPTEHEGRLAALPDRALGARITEGGCADAPGGAVLAMWGDALAGAAPEAGVMLLVNSFQADIVYVYVGDASAPVRCAPVPLQGMSAYDTACVLDGAGGAVEVEILRVVDGGATPPERMTLRLPVL